WVHWDIGPDQAAMLEFTRRVIAMRSAHEVFRRRRFFQGRPIRGADIKDIIWLSPLGREMSDDEWQSPAHAQALGTYLAGQGMNMTDDRGVPVVGTSVILLANAHHERVEFVLPDLVPEQEW